MLEYEMYGLDEAVTIVSLAVYDAREHLPVNS